MLRARLRAFAILAGIFVLAACGGGGGGGSAPPAERRGEVAGLVLVHDEVAAGPSDALGATPATALPDATPGERQDFGRTLSFASWSVAEAGLSGSTAADGTFTIGNIQPGAHQLHFEKSVNGNLIAFDIPLTVSGQDVTHVLAEVRWGRVASAVRFVDEAGEHVVRRGPSGEVVEIRDGTLVTLGDATRVFHDRDGDGVLDTCEDPTTGAGCVPAPLVGVEVFGPERLVVGQQAALVAIGLLGDGTQIDVTTAAVWSSSAPSVASIDSWGTVTAIAPGSAALTAALGEVTSAPLTLSVTPRPPLERIELQNVSCIYPLAPPPFAEGPVQGRPDQAASPLPTDGVWMPPDCGQVIEIGGTIKLRAIGQFADGYFEDLTDEATWTAAPDGVVRVDAGLVTGQAAGATAVTAAVDAVASDPFDVTVVAQPTLVALEVYFAFGRILPAQTEIAPPCTQPSDPFAPAEPTVCEPFVQTFLVGDTAEVRAVGRYDTGLWRDVTAMVGWSTSNPEVATVDAGVLTAHAAGEATLAASFEGVASNPLDVRIVAEATLQSLFIHEDGGMIGILKKGENRFFRALASYDIGLTRDVTDEVVWEVSDSAVGIFERPGVFRGTGAGFVQVSARAGEVRSDPIELEVFATSELAYCDPDHINRGVWEDDFNRVILESDCATYGPPDLVTLRYSIEALQPNPGRFDPCLDLYVYRGAERVRTIREEGCGDPFIAAGAPGRQDAAVVYQLRAFWDLRDDGGARVPAGSYTVRGVFYIYYDPVVTLDIEVR